MQSTISPSVLFFVIVPIFVISVLLDHVECVDERHANCSTFFNCGKIVNITYPFWGNGRAEYCGHPDFKLDCRNDNAIINILSQEYQIVDIDAGLHILRIARSDLMKSSCPEQANKSTGLMNQGHFIYTLADWNATLLYNCSQSHNQSLGYHEFYCSEGKINYFVLNSTWADEIGISGECSVSIRVPVLRDTIVDFRGVEQALRRGFEVKWTLKAAGYCGYCIRSGGTCGYNWTLSQFRCFCPDSAYNRACPLSNYSAPVMPATSEGKGKDWKLKSGLAAGGVAFGVIFMCLVFFIHQRRTKKPYPLSSYLSRKISFDPSSKTDLERMGSIVGLDIFSYGELEEATNHFDEGRKLGDGGFGTVYYGKLEDGRVVAVKRLYENNYRRLEQFINEIEILTRLRHQNLVTLYGCTSRRSHELLLVYEYIPNATVADHLHGERARACSLPWPTRLKIAIETASALTYLHASDVVHRDVKTDNILLDDGFRVKVADFGLSRLFPLDATHVSTAPQGTPGYVDPEYHQCYQLTSKSDVYSFGVVLVELISSLPAVDITRHRHEINLSNMAVDKIRNRALREFADPALGYESDLQVKKMVDSMADLAFRCLQSAKEMRPSMADVLADLKNIQRQARNVEKVREMDFPSEDDGLLKSDSVRQKWVSTSTTSGGSL